MADFDSSSLPTPAAEGANVRSIKPPQAVNGCAPKQMPASDAVTLREKQLLDEFEDYHFRVAYDLAPMLTALSFMLEAARVLTAIEKAAFEPQGAADTTLCARLDRAVPEWAEPRQQLGANGFEMLSTFAGVLRRLGDDIANDCRFSHGCGTTQRHATVVGDEVSHV